MEKINGIFQDSISVKGVGNQAAYITLVAFNPITKTRKVFLQIKPS
jgi:hypothetical protein